MRHRLSQAFFVLSLLTVGGAALADWNQRPPLTFRPDGGTVGYGNTQALPDVTEGWSLADSSDPYFSVVVGGTADWVLSQDAGVDWGHAGSNAMRVQSPDAASPTEYLKFYHDGTDGHIKMGSGRLKLEAESGGIVDILDTDGDFAWSFQGAVNKDAQLWATANSLIGFVLTVDAAFNQITFAPRDAAGGRQYILTDYVNRAKDHDHAAAPDPVHYYHSVTNPDTDNTQWGSVHFGSAVGERDFQIETGSGAIKLDSGVKLRRNGIGSTDSPYAVVFTDHVIGVDTSTGTVEVDLPAVASVGGGRTLLVKDESGDAAANNITVDPNGSENIDGSSTSHTISTAFGSVHIYTDGSTGWFIY